MDFKIEKKEHWNIKNYNSEEFKLAYKFSQLIVKEMPGLLQSVVLFGSSARKDNTVRPQDIDVLLLVNDVSIILTPEVSQTFRIITEKVAGRISDRFHINTMKLSNFWDYARNGDPIAVNMLRDGVPLYDIGVFEPVQQ
ncbi:MAG TPA: nucleotidyltransferase domain-containing protein, partial [Candidatus Nanoarchaeia archaeon]|nr:nucleotidyltransferase domain-containing protein [Candidatus Nanoarchaeia archaeon]